MACANVFSGHATVRVSKPAPAGTRAGAAGLEPHLFSRFGLPPTR